VAKDVKRAERIADAWTAGFAAAAKARARAKTKRGQSRIYWREMHAYLDMPATDMQLLSDLLRVAMDKSNWKQAK
jgi:hypothetical protein